MKTQMKSDKQPVPGHNPSADSSPRRRRRFSRGQTAVILAAALPALLGSVALSTDVAVLYYNWSILRKAVDAAVLAGAAYLPNQPSNATSTATSFGTENGIQASDTVSVSVSGDDKSITMTATRTVPYYFGKVLGLKTAPVSVTATAQIEQVGAARNLLPMGFDPPSTPTQYQMYTFNMAQVGAGNWDPLALGYTPSQDPGGNNYRNNIENGYSSTVNIGDWIYTETGTLNGPTQQGINYRITEGVSVDPSLPAGSTINSSTSYSLNDPRAVEVPIVNWANINGKSQVQVLGFAMMWLVGVDGNGNVQAEFIQQVAADNTPDPGATECSGVGQVCDTTYSAVLTQ
jgi:Flp pilus assembly protein TadG